MNPTRPPHRQTTYTKIQQNKFRNQQFYAVTVEVGLGELDSDEILEWTIEPVLATMADLGELVPILKRLIWQGKLSLDDLN